MQTVVVEYLPGQMIDMRCEYRWRFTIGGVQTIWQTHYLDGLMMLQYRGDPIDMFKVSVEQKVRDDYKTAGGDPKTLKFYFSEMEITAKRA